MTKEARKGEARGKEMERRIKASRMARRRGKKGNARKERNGVEGGERWR